MSDRTDSDGSSALQWVAMVAIGWTVASLVARILVSLALDWIPVLAARDDAVGLAWQTALDSALFLILGLIAVRLLVKMFDAPRIVWLGILIPAVVALAIGLGVDFFHASGFLGDAFGNPPMEGFSYASGLALDYLPGLAAATGAILAALLPLGSRAEQAHPADGVRCEQQGNGAIHR